MSDDESKEERALLRSREATNTLRTIQNTLSSDLTRISRTEQVLKRDKELFDKIQKRQNKYKDGNTKSKQLVKSIDRRQRQTKILADIGFYIFVFTVLYLLSKRIPSFVYEGVYLMLHYITEVLHSEADIEAGKKYLDKDDL